jgi:TolA-binding protein
MDFPGADTIADRLATLNPLSQVDEKSPIPPQVQMQLAQSQAQMQQMQQQLQQLQMVIKQRQDIEQVKQDNETKRELMKQTAKAHDIEMSNETKRRDVDMKVMGKEQDTKLMTDTMIEIENIKGQFALLLAHIDAAARRGAAIETEERAI